MGQVAQLLEKKLSEAFDPAELEVVDQSFLHEGHAGHDGRGESHFRVKIISARFEGQNRVQRQRMVNAALKEELAERVHALSIQALAPGEE
ncbi:MAG: BolA family protein [Pseudomonadota bacterium]